MSFGKKGTLGVVTKMKPTRANRIIHQDLGIPTHEATTPNATFIAARVTLDFSRQNLLDYDTGAK